MSDRVVRAITDDGAFRVVAATTTETVRGVARAQEARGELARHFGELVTGSILVREAMAPRLRVQGILKRPGAFSLVADAHPDGSNRGLVQRQGDAPIDLAPGALLQLMRTLPSGAIHQGIVEVPAGGISAALMTYLQESEQVVSTIAVHTALRDDEPDRSSGFLLQLLPEVERGPLMLMTERLAGFGPLDDLLRQHGDNPPALIDELLYGMPFTRLDEAPLQFACGCSEIRVLASLASLPRADIQELFEAGEVLEVRCDYCGRLHHVSPEQLRALLTSS